MREVMERRTFILLLITVSVLFAVILRPFWTPIFWALVVTVLFSPLRNWMLPRLDNRRTPTALLTLLTLSVAVILPVLLLMFSFINEGAALYERIESRQVSPGQFIDQVISAIPFLPELMARAGVDTESIRQYLASSATSISEMIATQALNIGRNTVDFTLKLALMLYLTFFLLRDGDRLVVIIRNAIPLSAGRKQLLFNKFVEVTRATIKGNLLVAIVQGALGGLIFWILGISGPVLWAVVMAFLSLIPAVGAALVWLPVAIYLYATGNWLQASVLIAYGALIIGLADNVLRPILVGRDTKLPDYVVLFSTIGGLSLMGVTGFVLGPLIAAVFMSFWTIFSHDLQSEDVDY